MLDSYCTYKIYEKNKHLIKFTNDKYERFKYGKLVINTNITIKSDINSIIKILDITEDDFYIKDIINNSTDIFIDSRYLIFNKHGKLTINKNIY
jgi:hypothetical protein